MKRYFLFLLLALLPMLANAYDAYIDGIYYDFSGNNATVTYGYSNYNSYSYSGTVVIPEFVTYNGNTYSVTSIGYCAFENCQGLTSITISNSVTSIGQYAFDGCSGLTSVTIPNSVTSIGSSAFRDCSSLQKVIVSDIAAWCAISFGDDDANPLYYAKHLFSDVETEITNLVIPEGVASIGGYAFYNCSSLTSVTIGNRVTSIGGGAFYGCSGLVSVTLKSNAIVSLDRSSSSSLGSIFGAQVKEYVIGDSVTSIGNYAFYGCSGLTSITIPNSVTSIGFAAFYKCSGLTNLISKATTPPLCGSQALEDINKWECTLSVPRGYIAAYQQADQWKDFFFMEEKSFEDAIVDVKADDVEEMGYYDLQGRKQSAPQKGFNIIRYSDGTSKKVFVK